MEEKIAERSGWVTGVVVAQFLCSALFAGACLILSVLIHQMRQQHGDEWESIVQALKLAIWIIGPTALILLLGAWGLLKDKLWGWWVAFLADVGLFGIFLYSMIDDGLKNIDWDMSAFTAVALVLVVCLLVPGVRRFYWNSENVANATLDPVNPAGTKA